MRRSASARGMKGVKARSAAPSRITKEVLVFVLSALLMVVYLLWRLLFTLPLDEGIAQAAFGILLLLAETVTSFTTFELYFLKVRNDTGSLALPKIPDSEYPDIDVFIATHNEPEAILFKTASACTYMEYPDPRKVHIFLCDDGNRPEIRALAERLGIGYIGLEGNRHAKSGNLNHALEMTGSPLVATFDADMIPVRSFLMDTVPYFAHPRYIADDETGTWRPRVGEELEDAPRIGLIQTPQSFYNVDLFQFNLYAENRIPNEQDFFSSEVNRMRNSSNSSAYTGSNTVISRAALEEIGGFPYHTITEDFETSCRLQKAGYLTYASDKVGAHGLTTTDVPAMMRQRVRWARGVITSIKNTNAIFTRKLPLRARISYLNVFLYWWSFFNRLVFILAPILFALFDFRVVDCELWQLLIFWLPSYIVYGQSMRFLSSKVRNQKWSLVIDTSFMAALIIPVFLETIGVSETRFSVTRKDADKGNTAGLRYLWLYILLAVMSVLALVRFTAGKYGMALLYSTVIIYWLCYNLIAILYAIAFLSGRRVMRKSHRIAVDAEVDFDFAGAPAKGRTINLSEEGALFALTGASADIPEEFRAAVSSGPYRALLDCRKVNSWQSEEGTRFSAVLTPVDFESEREYVQILHDREPGIAKEMDMWNTTFDDLHRILRMWIGRLLELVRGRR